MAKRMNPFVEDFVPQNKIHISLKQYNKYGSNHENRLQKVYEKTLAMLYKGSKKAKECNNVNNHNEGSSNTKDKMKQLFIGKDGGLLHFGSLVENKTVKFCKCGQTSESSCSYCESGLCMKCLLSCIKCMQTYCNQCLLLSAEGKEVCFSCYS